jgi:transposase
LRRVLTQAAWGFSIIRGSYFRAFYHRLAARKGKKRAIVAAAHALLCTGYMLLWTGRRFSNLGYDYFDRLDRERLTKRLLTRLEKLGHQVSIQPAASSGSA